MPEFELKQGDTVYLSGPMTGQPNNNEELFDAAQAHCESKGLVVISPVELGRRDGENLEGNGWDASDDEYEGFLERDMSHVARADAIVFLKGWSFSGGAGREGREAIELGKALYILDRDNATGEWFPFMRIPPSFFLSNSRTERLRPHEKEAKQSS
jgi:hypothetical protein